jgi:hypothetical protein
MFDKRGTGLCDRVPNDKLPTLEDRVDDLRAVMDAVGSKQAAVFGFSEGGNLSAPFSRPLIPNERKRSLCSALLPNEFGVRTIRGRRKRKIANASTRQSSENGENWRMSGTMFQARRGTKRSRAALPHISGDRRVRARPLRCFG